MQSLQLEDNSDLLKRYKDYNVKIINRQRNYTIKVYNFFVASFVSLMDENLCAGRQRAYILLAVFNMATLRYITDYNQT
jgi:hypothetical protein